MPWRDTVRKVGIVELSTAFVTEPPLGKVQVLVCGHVAVFDTPPGTAAEFTPVEFHAFVGDFQKAVATAKVVLALDVGENTRAAHDGFCDSSLQL